MKPIRLTLNQAIYVAWLPLPLFLTTVLLRNIYVILPVKLFFLAFIFALIAFILKAQFSIAVQEPEHVVLYRRFLRTLYIVAIILFILFCLFPFVIGGYGDVGYFFMSTSLLIFFLAGKMFLSAGTADD
jgi:hypothetical protein